MKIFKLDSYKNNSLKARNIAAPKESNSVTKIVSEPSLPPVIACNYMSNISFRGGLNMEEVKKYTLDMGKRIYSKRNVTDLAKIHSSAEGLTMGRGLPSRWLSRIKDIDGFSKDKFFKEFGNIFSQERVFADVDLLRDRIAALFQKYKIIDADTAFDIKYIGKGFQAWAYNIIIDGDENNGVVTKLFKRTYNYLQNHGNHTEQNLAEYVKQYAGDRSEFVKYYCGDTKNGIMLVDYLPPDIEEPKSTLDLEDFGIGYGDDFPKNRVNKHICDYGGIETKSNLVGNKVAQDVHSAIKYSNSDTEKVNLFNEIYSQQDQDDFFDKAIGLVHGIKYLPKEMQPKLYEKLYDIGSHRVNIALIQNIKNFSDYSELNPLVEKLCSTKEQKEQETIAKEIKHIPEKLRHRIFEEYSDSKISAVIKYLARNINQYYKNIGNRENIYEKFIENSDTYSGIALINSMKYVSSSSYDKYFEKFFAKNDPILNTTLARSLELFSKDTNLQEKWINKLLECDDIDVKTALCESVSFVDRSLRVELFDKLLSIKDHVAKEFLAQNITSVPGYIYHPDWVPRLLDGADNMIRGALINTLKLEKNEFVKRTWTPIILKGADENIKKMLET